MKVLRVRDVKMPQRAHSDDAGIDLFIPEEFIQTEIPPNGSAVIPSGLKVNIPEGYALIAFNKSGIAVKKNLIVGACVIDENYQGEMHIDIKNVGSEKVTLSAGDKIIQLVCLPINYVSIEEVSSEEELFPDGESTRGEGNFGSTGVK